MPAIWRRRQNELRWYAVLSWPITSGPRPPGIEALGGGDGGRERERGRGHWDKNAATSTVHLERGAEKRRSRLEFQP